MCERHLELYVLRRTDMWNMFQGYFLQINIHFLKRKPGVLLCIIIAVMIGSKISHHKQ